MNGPDARPVLDTPQNDVTVSPDDDLTLCAYHWRRAGLLRRAAHVVGFKNLEGMCEACFSGVAIFQDETIGDKWRGELGDDEEHETSGADILKIRPGTTDEMERREEEDADEISGRNAYWPR